MSSVLGNIHSVPGMSVRERIPLVWDFSSDSLAYGQDNLYPQRVEQIALRSGLTVTALNVLQEFTQGQGFVNESLGSQVINSSGMTMDDLLKFIGYDYSWFDVVAIHFQYNLNLRISEATPIFSKFCRFALPDEISKKIEMIRFSVNWEQNLSKTGGRPREIEDFWAFNTDPEVVRAQIQSSGGINNYPGQILYASEFQNIYPAVVYDPVLDAVQTNGEIPLYELSNIQNSFHPSTIFKYPGKFETEEEEREIKRKVQEMTGSMGAGSSMVVEVPEENFAEFDFLEPITVQNRDRMMEFTSRNNREAITQAFGTPPILLGFHPQTGFINQENMINSFNYYNQRTLPRRQFVETVTEKWFPFLQGAPAVDDYTIQPLFFVAAQEPPVVSPTGEVFERDQESGELQEVARGAARDEVERNNED